MPESAALNTMLMASLRRVDEIRCCQLSPRLTFIHKSTKSRAGGILTKGLQPSSHVRKAPSAQTGLRYLIIDGFEVLDEEIGIYVEGCAELDRPD